MIPACPMIDETVRQLVVSQSHGSKHAINAVCCFVREQGTRSAFEQVVIGYIDRTNTCSH